MSKLRVGDILIEDDRISMPHVLVPGATDVSVRRSRPPTGLLTWIAGLRMPSGVVGWTGAGLVVVGLAVEFAAAAWDNPIRAIARGGFLVPVGACLLGLALAKAYLGQSPSRVNRLIVGPDVDELLGRVAGLLVPGSSLQTVEWIQAKMGLAEGIVVRLLAILREDGTVSEELDPDSGDFYYRLIRQDPQDLDERLANANRRRH